MYRPKDLKRTTGFPSSGDEFYSGPLDVGEHVCPHPEITIFARMTGDAMRKLRIPDGALLIIEALPCYQPGHIVLAEADGEYFLRKIIRRDGRFALVDGESNLLRASEARILGLLHWSLNSHDDRIADTSLITVL